MRYLAARYTHFVTDTSFSAEYGPFATLDEAKAAVTDGADPLVNCGHVVDLETGGFLPWYGDVPGSPMGRGWGSAFE